jgi:hypothetical protein
MLHGPSEKRLRKNTKKLARPALHSRSEQPEKKSSSPIPPENQTKEPLAEKRGYSTVATILNLSPKLAVDFKVHGRQDRQINQR